MWDLKVLNTDKALYIAIADAIERDVRRGILKPGDRMPTHRKLADIIGVNVTTVTRAYGEAEKRGLITAVVGSGTFITGDGGNRASLMNTSEQKHPRIEMGLVFPLYSAEPDIRPLLLQTASRSFLKDLTKYVPPQGLLRHREIGAAWVKRFGICTDADRIIITSGIQYALNCILSSLFLAGDHIAADCITYPGIKSAARRYGVRLEAVDMDEEGMLPQSLDALCSRMDIKGIYTVSRLQNPTNIVMSESRRLDLADVIRRRGLLLIEDDLYGFLAPEGTLPLSAALPDQSLYLAGLSKAFYPGLRIGFLVSPEKYRSRISQTVVDTVWMASPLNAEIACNCIESGMADEIIRTKKEALAERSSMMFRILKHGRIHYAPHNMFAWIELPDGMDGRSFEEAAAACGIRLFSSDRFTVGSTVPPDCIRVSLTGADHISDFEQGLILLEKLFNHEIGEVSGIL